MPAPTQSPVLILHAHTVMSMLDGASSADEYVKFATANSHPICGCTDHGWLSGVYDLVAKSNKAGIRPVPGCEFYLTPHPDHKFAGEPYKYFHLTVWASGTKGYSNLVGLATKSWEEDRPVSLWGKPRPRIQWRDLEMFNEGLIVGSGCIEGPIGKCLLHNEVDQAWRNARMLKDLFGERLFFEMMPSTVDRDYVKGVSISVAGENGTTFRFMPDDILVTDQGEMTATEALSRRPAEILFVRPYRVQDGELNPGSMVNDGAEIHSSEILVPPDDSVPFLNPEAYCES